MKKAPLALLACFCSLSLSAQYEKILADPAVTWAAEIELYLSPEVVWHEWPYDSLNDGSVLKTVNTAFGSNSPFADAPTLMQRLFDVVLDDRWPAFADAELTQPLTLDDVLSRFSTTDTILLNAFTPEEHIAIVRNDLLPADCPLVRVRQLLFYRDQTAEFGLITRSIAPALRDGRALCWLAVPPSGASAPSLDDPNITWARRLRTQAATPTVAALNSLKQPAQPVLRVFVQRVRTDTTVAIRDISDWRLVAPDDRELLFFRTDTLITFDPETYEEKIMIVQIEPIFDELQRLRLVQDWYWDERRQRLLTRLVAVGPMVNVMDEQGNFRFSRPLFYRRNE